MKRRILVLITVIVLAVFAAVYLVGCSKIDMTTPSFSDNNDNGDNGDDNNNGDNGDNGDDNNNNDNNDDDNNNNNNNDDNNNDRPMNTKTTVYYTNSNNWSNVYAYVWNYATDSPKKAWPGERLTSFGTSGSDYGNQKQYKIEVDYSQYDRIIFNDGRDGGAKTKDLVVSAATSGYYGEDGTFTMGTDDYGNVAEKVFTDSKNLSYIGSKSKKVWIYTPPNYTPAKKYGVLYMFDGQNAFGAASGVKENGNSWCVDVAITSLIKNGGDGVIVVAIDNGSGGSELRNRELTMSLNFGTLTSLADEAGFDRGVLDELGNFIKQTVMPWVKSNYSVDGSREKTGIVGSSSGGIAAYYLGLRDNDVYGYLGAFSPANGLFQSGDWTRFYQRKNNFADGKPKVYVYCGQNDKDLEDMLLPETKKIKSGLRACGFAAADITENYVDGGTHNEAYWRVAFLEFLGKMVG